MFVKKFNSFELDQTLRVREAISKKVNQDKLEEEIIHFREWYNEIVVASEKINIKEISLSEMKNWSEKNIDGKNIIAHSSKDFFQIIGLRIANTDTREVMNGWDQPIIKQIGLDGGILGLIINLNTGFPEILIEAKFEPGNVNKIQVSPTLQATFANINKKHGGRQPRFVDFFLNPDQYDATILLDQLMSEDGGRLFQKRNRNILLEVSNKEKFLNLPPNFRWVSIAVIKYLIRNSDIINPHIRSILSGF